MTKCIFCEVNGDFYRGAEIGNKGKGICENCMAMLAYYIKRQDLIEIEDYESRRRGLPINNKL